MIDDNISSQAREREAPPMGSEPSRELRSDRLDVPSRYPAVALGLVKGISSGWDVVVMN